MVEIKQVAAALVKAQRSFGPALKTKTNPHLKAKYADLGACIEAVIDALNENGIMLTQPTHESAEGVMVETVFVHESGESFSAGKLFLPASKKDAQGYGSALTYARRYSLMAACGIAPEDDDGERAKTANSSEPEISKVVADGLRDAAMHGSEALKKAWQNNSKTPGFADWWKLHADELKQAAAAADEAPA